MTTTPLEAIQTPGKQQGEIALLNPSRNIYWIGGSKGGVGKSLIAMSAIDHLTDKGSKVFLVDSDTSNPDVWKAYEKQLDAECVDLDGADGWIQLVNICDRHREGAVVVNTAARNNHAVTRFGGILGEALPELGRRLIALWVINRQRDCLELLKQFVDAMPSAEIHVVRNGYFGPEQKFELYNGSKVREAIESKGGRSLTFPDLADRVTDDIYSRRLALASALQTLPLGNRAELSRWRSEARRMLTEVVM